MSSEARLILKWWIALENRYPACDITGSNSLAGDILLRSQGLDTAVSSSQRQERQYRLQSPVLQISCLKRYITCLGTRPLVHPDICSLTNHHLQLLTRYPYRDVAPLNFVSRHSLLNSSDQKLVTHSQFPNHYLKLTSLDLKPIPLHSWPPEQISHPRDYAYTDTTRVKYMTINKKMLI